MVRIAVAALLTSAAALQIQGQDQLPLGPSRHSSDFRCNLPPAIDPAKDGMPSEEELFSSKEALKTQVKRHQAVVRIPSISYDDHGAPNEDPRWAPFWDLHKELASLYPLLHKHAELEKVNTLNLVYTLKGSDPKLKPTLLAAHQDVVPVADASTWKYPPFEAVYDGEYLWGRGASDDKDSLTALLSATETLLAKGWKPRRTLILAFGFDEECSGYLGAVTIAEHLLKKYGHDGIGAIIDEGGADLVKFGDVLYAVPALMEKGHVDVWFDLSISGGHSSIPFPHTGIGIMAEMITALEAHPYNAQVIRDSAVHKHFECQAKFSPDAMPKVTELLRNDDLEGLAKWMVKEDRIFQYMIQTSQAVDVIRGGQKINAMPEKVSLGVNYRVAPQDSIPKVQHNIVKYINDTVNKHGLKLNAFEGDPDYKAYLAENNLDLGGLVTSSLDADSNGMLTIKAVEKSIATPETPMEGKAWDVFSGVVQHTFRSMAATVVPVGDIMTGNTDTRHYLDLSRNIYRFTPHTMNGTLNIHTVDERIHMGEHMDVVKFYYNFIRSFDQADL